TMALLASLPKKSEPVRFDDYSRYASTTWASTALNGTASELRSLLDGGLSPDASLSDVSLLMMAAPDLEKTSLLLSRGANPRYRSSSGYDALTVAASYRGSAATMKALL